MTPTEMKRLNFEPFDEASPTALADAIRAWQLANAKESTAIDLIYAADGGRFTALLVYTR